MRAQALAQIAVTLMAAIALAPASAVGQSAGPPDMAAFSSYLAQYFASHREQAPDTTYQYASIDLDGDGRREMLVYLEGPSWCGPHSCDLFIFTPDRAGGWRLVQELALAAPPITELSTRSRGWRDLGVHYSTSLAPGERRILSWRGSGYALSPRRLRDGAEGRALIGRGEEGVRLFAAAPPRDR